MQTPRPLAGSARRPAPSRTTAVCTLGEGLHWFLATAGLMLLDAW